jgi:hypothetical protein
MSGDGDPQKGEEKNGDEAAQPESLHLLTKRVERRLPHIGVVSFRELTLAEERLLPSAADDQTDPRTFANTLIALAIEKPRVSANDVDGWSERTRAIARVAAAEVLGCLAEYRRLSGSGESGDERLLAAIRERNRKLFGVLANVNMTSVSDALRQLDRLRPLIRPSIFEQMERQQRQAERLLRPYQSSVFEQIQRQQKQIERLTNLQNPLADLTKQVERLRRASMFGTELHDRLDVWRRSGLHNLLQSSALEMSRTYLKTFDVVSRQLNNVARPSYFDALRRVSQPQLGPTFTAFSKVAAQIQTGPTYFGQIARMLERFRAPTWLFTLRSQIAGSLETYEAWLEREWERRKAEKSLPPVMFFLASLPGIVAIPLLKAFKTDDELLLGPLEAELASSNLVESLQASVQANAMLDSVAKQHLVRGLGWVGRGQYVDAAPPLYKGLERAFRLFARKQEVIDERNCFLVKSKNSRRRARGVEDYLPYIGLDRLFVRFLHAWVFGEEGNLARHGDLTEDAHRRWVLRAVIAVIGWLEQAGGEEGAIEKLVARLELEGKRAEAEEAEGAN